MQPKKKVDDYLGLKPNSNVNVEEQLPSSLIEKLNQNIP